MILESSKSYGDVGSEFTLDKGNPSLRVAIVIDKRYKNQMSVQKLAVSRMDAGLST